jgi:hypothetical protein
MGKLVLFRAGGAAQDIALDRERITIGRRPDNDVCLAHPAVSGEHAAVVTILSDSFLEDLGSTNGTRVNGDPIGKHFLCDGDEIEIGRQVLVYVVDESMRLLAPPKRPDREAAGVSTGTPGNAAAPGASAAQRDDLRGDEETAVSEWSVEAVHGSVAAGIEGGADVAQSAVPDRHQGPWGTPANAPVPPDPELRVLSGASAGRVIPLTKRETLIGRAGVQVAALRREAGGIRLVAIEGSVPPSVNGMPIAPGGSTLAAGDIVVVAGARLQFVVPSEGTG